jgi:hypothetical protein
MTIARETAILKKMQLSQKPLVIAGLVLVLASLVLQLIDFRSGGRIRWFDIPLKLYLIGLFFYLIRKPKNSPN